MSSAVMVRKETFTNRQQAAINKAKYVLQKHTWFKSVIVDNLPADCNLATESQFSVAVERLIADTMYFDGP
jgi:hypothetical protein